MMRMNLQCTPTLWVPFIALHALNLFPCSAPRGSPSTLCLAARPCCTRECRAVISQWAPASSPLEPDCDWVRTLILPSEMTFLYSLGFFQSRRAHAHRDGSGIAARARKRELPLKSPSREELVSPTPCLHVPCRDSILPSLSDFACPSPAFPAYQKTLVSSSHVSCFSRKPPIPQDFYTMPGRISKTCWKLEIMSRSSKNDCGERDWAWRQAHLCKSIAKCSLTAGLNLPA